MRVSVLPLPKSKRCRFPCNINLEQIYLNYKVQRWVYRWIIILMFEISLCCAADRHFLCFQVWVEKKTQCLCTVDLEVTPCCPALASPQTQTAPSPPGPSSEVSGTLRRWAGGRWGRTQTNPAACPSHPTALSHSVTSGSMTPAPMSACRVEFLSLTFTSPSSPSPPCPPSLTCSLEETSPLTASCSPTTMLAAAGRTPACSTSAGRLQTGRCCSLKTTGAQITVFNLPTGAESFKQSCHKLNYGGKLLFINQNVHLFCYYIYYCLTFL